ncbi:PAS domain S-box protein [Ramlibacter terrae]|uniref:PAS domain S-box protein n=1 Tax=Ramlibacter terrae TaxID=2732511 RepID=A0ABX6P4C2_9BURK|nr:PAS domain S-box protein [Ramlibacter terrae]
MPYRTIDDRISGVVFTFIDITERKQAEETRLWLAAVMASTSDAIISFAPDQTILSWNSGAQKLYGYSAEDAIGQPMSMLAPTRVTDRWTSWPTCSPAAAARTTRRCAAARTAAK